MSVRLMATSLVAILGLAASRSAVAQQLLCANSIRDQSQPFSCLQASSVPTIGLLYPLSVDFNVDAYGSLATGRIGPYRLDGNTNSRYLTMDVGANYGDPVIELARYATAGGVGVGTIEFINSYNTTQKLIAAIEGDTVGTSSDQGGWIQFFTKTTDSGTGIKARMVIDDLGNVGIGTQAPAYTLDVNGEVRAVGGFVTSDARYKKNVEPLANALEQVTAMRGVRFDWDRDGFPQKNFPSGRQVGFIAQEMERVLPDVVATDKDGGKSVSYTSIVPVLVEAVKAQQRIIDDQQQQIASLKAGDAEVKSQVAHILELLQAGANATAARK